jgi:integrase
MPSIEERPTPEGKPGYRVKIRLAGTPTQSATFTRLTDAKRWAQSTETAIREGRYFKSAVAKKHTVAQLIDKYIAEILPTKPPHAQTQRYQLIWWKQQLGHLTLADLTAPEIGKCRDKLLAHEFRPGKTTTPGTVVRYLAALSHALSTAVKDWEWLDDSPMRKVRKPKEPRGRTRTLSKAEIQSLLAACKSSKNRHLYLIALLAVSTGMRLGEILTLKRAQVHIEKRRLILNHTKNGDQRAVALAGPALTGITDLIKTLGNPDDLLFPGRCANKPTEIRKPWNNALKRAGIVNFRFHDLRHTASSLLLESGASLGQLAEVLGHRSLSMVKRYSHLSESHSAKLVATMNAGLFAEA